MTITKFFKLIIKNIVILLSFVLIFKQSVNLLR